MQKGGWSKIAYLAVFVAALAWGHEAYALSFSPVHIFAAGKAGEEIKGEIELYNEANEPIRVHASVDDFSVGKTPGIPIFSGEASSQSLKGIAHLSANDFSMKPGERRVFTYALRIPTTEVSGTKYGAIHFGSASKTSTGSAVAVTGPLVFVTIGEQDDAAVSVEVRAGNALKTMQPSGCEMKVHNAGSDFVLAKSACEVTNIFGKTVWKMEGENPGTVFMPGERTVTLAPEKSTWMRKWLTPGMGPYRMTGMLSRKDGTVIARQSKSYWVIPARMLGLIALGITASMFAIWRKTRKNKKKV